MNAGTVGVVVAAVLAVAAAIVIVAPLITQAGVRRGGADPAHASSARASDDDIEARVRAMSLAHRECPACGVRPEADAEFCSTCGAALAPRE